MQERRYHKRYKVDVMDIRGEIAFARNVNLLDISLSGALLKTDKSPNLGNSYLLKMQSGEKTLEIQGIIIRSTIEKAAQGIKGRTATTYTAGMHFTNLSEEKIFEIAKFIKNHNLDKSEPPAA